MSTTKQNKKVATKKVTETKPKETKPKKEPTPKVEINEVPVEPKKEKKTKAVKPEVIKPEVVKSEPKDEKKPVAKVARSSDKKDVKKDKKEDKKDVKKDKKDVKKSQKKIKGGKAVEAENEEENTSTRYFKVIHDGEDESTAHGRFSGSKPKQAANKAFTSIVKEAKGALNGETKFSIIECTRKSKNKRYFYTATRELLNVPTEVIIGDKKTKSKYTPESLKAMADAELEVVGLKRIKYKCNNKVSKDKDHQNGGKDAKIVSDAKTVKSAKKSGKSKSE